MAIRTSPDLGRRNIPRLSPPPPRVDPGQRRRSLRAARTALRQVFTEVTPAQRSQLRRQGATTVPILEEGHATGFAAIGGKQVGFGTVGGKLAPKIESIIGLARHEVGHLLGAGHFAGQATPSTSRTSSDVGTVQGLRAVPRTENIPQGQKFSRAQTIAEREGRIPPRKKFGRAPEKLTPMQRTAPGRQGQLVTESQTGRAGFQTPHLLRTAVGGAPARQKEAREKMRRLGRRLRGRIDF